MNARRAIKTGRALQGDGGLHDKIVVPAGEPPRGFARHGQQEGRAVIDADFVAPVGKDDKAVEGVIAVRPGPSDPEGEVDLRRCEFPDFARAHGSGTSAGSAGASPLAA